MKATQVFTMLFIIVATFTLAACDGAPVDGSDQVAEDTATSSESQCEPGDVLLFNGLCGHSIPEPCHPSERDNPSEGSFCVSYTDDACRIDSQSQSCKNNCMRDSSIHEACAAFVPQLSEQASLMLRTKWTLKEYGYQMSEKTSPIEGANDHLWFGDDATYSALDTPFPYSRSIDCNTTYGEYQIVDNTLTLGAGWTTLIFCPNADNQDLQDQVDFISDVLASPVVFSIEGNLLTLTAGDSAQLIYTGN
ncbi:META domain-containing protein [Marinagarivorans cellulosilyticus]|uniref:DUF306 domain-containing protein n=1 Tax=Marinagarivorans cellulosilyticus TaxID=2721545 RepID=A0AAN1WL60_9GAMM|nr:META domain-containing protein [Marinagarivorans cellulosilyticus]BCD99610.1 hypothetical protein MARGE09_P3812 [Marinagarivorans cellulosilyticus]